MDREKIGNLAGLLRSDLKKHVQQPFNLVGGPTGLKISFYDDSVEPAFAERIASIVGSKVRPLQPGDVVIIDRNDVEFDVAALLEAKGRGR